MTAPSDPESHSMMAYDRPGSAWQCGRSLAGQACASGPNPDGRCPFSVTASAGNDSIDASPCIPLRTSRARLRQWSVWVAILAVGIWLLGYSLLWQDATVSTGALSAPHSAATGQCSDCHGGELAGHSGLSMNDRCASCHQLGENAGQAHSVSRERLLDSAKQRTEPVEPSVAGTLLALSKVMADATMQVRESVACASCHKEHRGRNGELTQIDDLKCGGCHAKQFVDFEKSHPQFAEYPYFRRTRIIYDHALHKDSYYPITGKAFSCSDCHRVGGDRKQMGVKPMEVACLNCHGSKQVASTDSGKLTRQFPHGQKIVAKPVSFFGLPRLDLVTLAEQGVQIGSWPTTASSQGVTPFMDLLLRGPAADGRAGNVALLERLRGVDLTSLKGAENSTLQDVAALVTEVKRLLASLADSDRSASGLLGYLLTSGVIDRDEYSAMLTDAGPTIFRSALQTWFANDAAASVQRDPQAGFSLVPVSPGRMQAAAGRWRLAQGAATITFQPSGHADSFLKSWLSVALRLSDRRGSAAQEALGLRASANDLLNKLGGLAQRPGEANGPGACLMCHSIERRSPAEAGMINWQALRPNVNEKRFFNFSHGPHLQLGEDKTCRTCHKLEPPARTPAANSVSLASYMQEDVSAFAGNFGPMSKKTCGQCHNKQAAADSCLQCHNYHVGEVGSSIQWTAPTRKK